MLARLFVGGVAVFAICSGFWYMWDALRTGVAGSELGGRFYRHRRRNQPVSFFASVFLGGFSLLFLGACLGLVAFDRFDLLFG